MFEPCVRVTAPGLPQMPAGNPGAEERTVDVLGLQRVPSYSFLHIHGERVRQAGGAEDDIWEKFLKVPWDLIWPHEWSGRGAE